MTIETKQGQTQVQKSLMCFKFKLKIHIKCNSALFLVKMTCDLCYFLCLVDELCPEAASFISLDTYSIQ